MWWLLQGTWAPVEGGDDSRPLLHLEPEQLGPKLPVLLLVMEADPQLVVKLVARAGGHLAEGGAAMKKAALPAAMGCFVERICAAEAQQRALRLVKRKGRRCSLSDASKLI